MVDWYSQIRYTVPESQEIGAHNQHREYGCVDSPVLPWRQVRRLQLRCLILCVIGAVLVIAGEEGVLETLI